MATALVAVAGLGLSTPAYAAALSNVSWSLSQPQPGTSGTRYTWSFTTPSGGTISAITFSVPSGTAGASLTPIDVYGLGAGTAALSGTTVTYTVTTPAAVAGGTSILVSIDGFTNTSTPGNYASTVTTLVGGTSTDTSGSNTVAVSANSTAVNVVVARSTAFASDTTGFNMLMDPSVTSLTTASRAVNLTIATNAAHGYTLTTSVNQALTGTLRSSSTFSPATVGISTGVPSVGAGSFGYTVTASGVGTVQGSPLTAGKYVGYTTAGETPVSASGPTNGDTVTITNAAKIDYTQPADRYTGTITYTVTPSY